MGVKLVVENYEKHSSHQTFLVSHNLKMASKISNVSNGRLEPWFTMLVKILTQVLKATMTTLRQHCKLQNQGYHVNTFNSTYIWDVGGYSISLLILEVWGRTWNLFQKRSKENLWLCLSLWKGNVKQLSILAKQRRWWGTNDVTPMGPYMCGCVASVFFHKQYMEALNQGVHVFLSS